ILLIFCRWGPRGIIHCIIFCRKLTFCFATSLLGLSPRNKLTPQKEKNTLTSMPWAADVVATIIAAIRLSKSFLIIKIEHRFSRGAIFGSPSDTELKAWAPAIASSAPTLELGPDRSTDGEESGTSWAGSEAGASAPVDCIFTTVVSPLRVTDRISTLVDNAQVMTSVMNEGSFARTLAVIPAGFKASIFESCAIGSGATKPRRSIVWLSDVCALGKIGVNTGARTAVAG